MCLLWDEFGDVGLLVGCSMDRALPLPLDVLLAEALWAEKAILAGISVYSYGGKPWTLPG